MNYPTAIDKDAAIVVRHERRIDAPLELVWRLHTDVGNWTRWQADIDSAAMTGAFEPGTTFRWATKGLSIESTIYVVEPHRHIVWGGPAHGIVGIHEWTFTQSGRGVLVHTEESWDGEPVLADIDNMRQALDNSIETWLELLATAAERS